ncbi:hypothetical protein L0P85_02920 [Terrisporobacter glycolicus]|nr:hypothetical protein L0P85_02920 [Terrisporobacter glycolicus]
MNKLKDLKLKNQLIISTYIMIFLLFILKPTLIPNLFSKLAIAFKPFIIGGVIAFLINLPMKLIEEKIVKPLCKNNRRLSKFSRTISLVSTLVIVVVLIGVFISYIVPHLADSLSILTNGIPSYINSLQSEIMSRVNDLEMLKNTSFDIQSMIQKFLTFVQNVINMFISNIFNFTIGITNFFMNLFLE